MRAVSCGTMKRGVWRVIGTLLCEARVLERWLPLAANGRNQTESRRTPGAWRITRGGGIIAPLCVSGRMAHECVRLCVCVEPDA